MCGLVCVCVHCAVARLCSAWYWHLAPSVEGKLRFGRSQRQLPWCISSLYHCWRVDPHHWLLRLLWSHHGEPVHAANGQSIQQQ